MAGDWPVHVYLDLSKIAPKVDKVRQKLRSAILESGTLGSTTEDGGRSS